MTVYFLIAQRLCGARDSCHGPATQNYRMVSFRSEGPEDEAEEAAADEHWNMDPGSPRRGLRSRRGCEGISFTGVSYLPALPWHVVSPSGKLPLPFTIYSQISVCEGFPFLIPVERIISALYYHCTPLRHCMLEGSPHIRMISVSIYVDGGFWPGTRSCYSLCLQSPAWHKTGEDQNK